MDAAILIKLLILVSVFSIVVSIGMRTRPEDTLALIHHPRQAARATVSMFVIMPLIVIYMTWLMGLAPPIPAALIALALSPMPPLLPRKEDKAGGEADYIISLQVLASATSLVIAPVFIPLAGWLFDVRVAYSPGNVFVTLFLTVAAPLALGIVIRRYFPDIAARLKGPLGRLAMITLVLGGLAVVVAAGPKMIEKLGSGVLLTSILIVLVSLGVGHLLGGPHEGNRGALAVATAARHPGVAIGMGTTYYPLDQPAVIAVVLTYTLVSVVVCMPYVQWRRRVMQRRG